MSSIHDRRAAIRLVSGAALAMALAFIAAGSSARSTPNPRRSSPPPPASADTIRVPAVDVRDTPDNLQFLFTNEMNAKTRYEAFAVRADREGYPEVARLFRACARAEQIHADRHVTAIAWTGGEARALLDRPPVGTTCENLQYAIASERFEAEQLYPALMARARADHQSAAVRSMNFALSAEREHLRLFTAALATLEQRPAAHAIYVCPFCGKTVTSLDFSECPNCFTSARRFISVA